MNLNIPGINAVRLGLRSYQYTTSSYSPTSPSVTPRNSRSIRTRITSEKIMTVTACDHELAKSRFNNNQEAGSTTLAHNRKICYLHPPEAYDIYL